MFKFVAAALLMCATSACIGPFVACLGGMADWHVYGTMFATWWTGDVVGVLVVTPLIMAWWRKPGLKAPWPAAAEALCAVALTVALGHVLFVGSLPKAAAASLS